MTARDNEAAMLKCCAMIATGALDSPRTPAEANVCRVAGMILGRHLHDARQRLSQAADAYFAVHPSELLESAETVRRGWIINLPRLRDRLERRLREVGPGEEGQQTTLDAIAELESGNGQSLTTVDGLFADLQANDGNAGLQPILVIDLEATCDEGDGLPTMDMEIIEIGAVWATAEGTVLDQFQALVRPVVWPQLTPFCRQLTNIQQADVDGAELFPAVAARLASFAQRHQAQGATWGSWGQFDAKQLARDCERHGIESPLAAFEHVNLKRRFAKARKIKEVGMARALQMVGLPLDGAHHRGLDDARNIAKLLPWSL